MILFLRLAVRNVFRNRIRTVVALSAIGAGCAALILNGGIVFNIFRELREDAIRGRLGHLQIYRRGYSEKHLEDPEHYLIPSEEANRILRLAHDNSKVVRATRRREFTGLISDRDRHVPFLGIGVEPEEDVEFSRHTTLRAGAALSAENPNGALLGLGLAKKLNGKTGDALSLMATTKSGSINTVHARLRGIFEGGLKEYDDWALKAPLLAVEQLLLDDRTEQIVVLVSRTEQVPEVRAELEGAFRREGLDLETQSWNELALFHNQVVSLFGRELGIIRLIVATIVILGIGNAIGMSIIERGVELATLRAVGIRARAIAVLLFTEALLMGLIGAAIGTALGVGIARVVSQIGILYPSPPGSTRPFVGGVDIIPAVVAASFLISVGASLVAAVFPAWRAVRCPIASVLRHS